ncbi:PilZ domain-containing protein [Bradyrhizobium sp. 186]|nr:PilZ domain-containing protein [Bradyrhizobium sp. 186]
MFDSRYDTTVVAIDGTWSLTAQLHDISDSGARVQLLAKVAERVRNEEFFLMITPDGKVSRRAKMAWEDGNYIGIHFVTSAGSAARRI